MATSKKTVDRKLIAKAEEEFKKLKDHNVYIRLIAIIQTGNRPVNEVARDFKVSSRSIFRWIKRFKKEGVDGLRDKPKGHNPSKLTDNHKRQIFQWYRDGQNARGDPIKWTLENLKCEIQREFGISISIMPLWSHLRKMGLK